MEPKIYYTDIISKKKHWTRKKFVCWQRGGILNVPGVVLAGKSQTIWIPIYLLSTESLKVLPPHPMLTPEAESESK